MASGLKIPAASEMVLGRSNGILPCLLLYSCVSSSLFTFLDSAFIQSHMDPLFGAQSSSQLAEPQHFFLDLPDSVVLTVLGLCPPRKNPYQAFPPGRPVEVPFLQASQGLKPIAVLPVGCVQEPSFCQLAEITDNAPLYFTCALYPEAQVCDDVMESNPKGCRLILPHRPKTLFRKKGECLVGSAQLHFQGATGSVVLEISRITYSPF